MGVRLKVGSSPGHFTVKPGQVVLVPGFSKDQYLTRQRTVVDAGHWAHLQGGRGDRPRSLTFTITRALTQDLVLEGVRPKSDTKVTGETEKLKPRVPILGPTRQQTELYMAKMARRKTDDFRYAIYFHIAYRMTVLCTFRQVYCCFGLKIERLQVFSCWWDNHQTIL